MLVANPLIHEFVESQVAQTPDAVAVIYQGRQLTYRELNHSANQLARYLQQLGVSPDVLVGIYMERSLEMIVGLLAILKAGGAYIPLDPAYPTARLEYMMENACATLLLTQSSLQQSFSSPENITIICLDEIEEALAGFDTTNIPSRTQPQNLAYVIYTSGSTGQPKGVAMPHQSLCNLLDWQLKDFELKKAKTLQFTPVSFDVSFQEIFVTLASGGTLVLVSESTRRDMESLWNYIQEQAIERLFLPFVALQNLAEVAKTHAKQNFHLREVITAGEQLKITNSIVQWVGKLKDCTLYNQYGPSESHVVTSYKLSGSPQNWPLLPAIGTPIANTEIYLLDPKLRRQGDPIKLVQDGEPGELAISGIALAQGYVNQPELSKTKFLANPFSSDPNSRLYRTGDIVRRREDGNLEYIERIDNQVKIRGIRVELGEIEAALGQHPSIKDTVVIAQRDAIGNNYLSAYVITKNIEEPPQKLQLISQLRTFLKQKLPNCLIPSTFEFMDHFPLTPSGKVDRRGLPDPHHIFTDEAHNIENKSLSLTEQKLLAIWSEVLFMKQIKVEDNFFDLGGDSLRAIQLVFKVREVFQIDLPIIDLFDAPTVVQLAERVNAAIHSRAKTTSDDISISALEAETLLDSSIDPGSLSFEYKDKPENIFITGVTGFLGAFLLQELLERTTAEIHCLVRASNEQLGLEKIVTNLRKYLLWNESYKSRIRVVHGDLALPLLGISEEGFDQLAEKIDVIYHNGASINLIYPYSALRPANVVGTQEILKLATRKRVKPVHFISTLDVFQNSQSFSSVPIREEDELNSSEAIHFDGYTKTKWVSEQMIHHAQLRGLPATVYRPAMITGHSQTGAANLNDLMNRLIKGFVQLHYAPSFDMVINIAPVDYFSKGVVYLSSQNKFFGKAYNFINPKPIWMSQFIEIINQCGYPVEQVSHSEWEKLLIKNNSSLDGVISVLTSKRSEISLSYLERSSVGADKVSCHNVISDLKNTPLVCPEINAQLLSTYFSFFKQTKFISDSYRSDFMHTSIPATV